MDSSCWIGSNFDLVDDTRPVCFQRNPTRTAYLKEYASSLVDVFIINDGRSIKLAVGFAL